MSRVTRQLANALKFRTVCLTSSADLNSEDKKLRMGTEIVISTPGKLLSFIKTGALTLNHAQVMILDEVDVLFQDETFPLQLIGDNCSPNSQFLFTTATLPQQVINKIQEEFPSVVLLSGPGLHRIAPTIDETVIDCSGSKSQTRSYSNIFENKRKVLLELLDNTTNNKNCERTIIFCNTIEQCRRVENILTRDDKKNARVVLPYHSALDTDVRENNLNEFSRLLLKKPVVLISTDRASRGMDFNTVQVINRTTIVAIRGVRTIENVISVVSVVFFRRIVTITIVVVAILVIIVIAT